MNTFFVQPGYPGGKAELEKCLQNFVKSVLDSYDAGMAVSLHTHNSVQEVGPEFLFGQLVHDFRHTGWTFGVSVGEYPRGAWRPDAPITIRG